MTATELPPARYAVGQAGYDHELARRLRILVDGVEQKEVVGYDCEAGTVLRLKLDENGKAQTTPDRREVWRETVTGHVTVEWKD